VVKTLKLFPSVIRPIKLVTLFDEFKAVLGTLDPFAVRPNCKGTKPDGTRAKD
jgi:hypothetical protein